MEHNGCVSLGAVDLHRIAVPLKYFKEKLPEKVTEEPDIPAVPGLRSSGVLSVL